jgi:hypothetical protein
LDAALHAELVHLPTMQHAASPQQRGGAPLPVRSMTRLAIETTDLLAELLEVERQYPGGSARSYEIRKEIEATTGERATSGDWITAFWVKNRLYEHFGWPYPPRWLP